jgi:hypothetical protein
VINFGKPYYVFNDGDIKETSQQTITNITKLAA